MKHPHAEVIKAWADGKTVQVLAGNGEWSDMTYSDGSWNTFSPQIQYRIKPEEVVEYTVVHKSGLSGSHFLKTVEAVGDFYFSELTKIQGFLKRTTVDGKVVKMEFVPK